MQEYDPPADVTIVFLCAQNVRGRIYPNPANPSIRVLDFIDEDGARIVRPTGFNIYYTGRFGDGPRFQVSPLGSTVGVAPENRITIDLYVLNPESMVEIDNGEVVKQISFVYTGRFSITSVIRNKSSINLVH